jgi:hypothetical protein
MKSRLSALGSILILLAAIPGQSQRSIRPTISRDRAIVL